MKRLTKNELLEALKAFTEGALGGLRLPVELQEEDEAPPLPRRPEVHTMGLRDYTEAQRKAPYVIHQVVTARDVQQPGQLLESTAVVRSIFAVYHPDGHEGPLALLGCMERLRIALLKQGVVGRQFTLDTRAGVEYLVYPDNIPPFYAGEMVSTWILPPVGREVAKCL